MKPELRGHMEGLFDNYLDDEKIKKKVSIFKFYHGEGVIDSVRSAILGDVWGTVLTGSLFLSAIYEEEDDFEEIITVFKQIFDTRILEIKSKIDKILMQ